MSQAAGGSASSASANPTSSSSSFSASNFKLELSLPSIQSLVTQPNIPPSILVDKFADLEAHAANIGLDEKSVQILSVYYSCYILALILEDNIHEARFLSQRFDKNLLHNDGLVISAYTVLRALWNRDYVVFHQTAQNAPWGEVATVMALRVIEHQRRRTLNLLSHAYTSIPPSSAATYLGIPTADEATRLLVEQHGWNYDQSLNLLSPGRREELLPKNRDISREEQAKMGGDTPTLSTGFNSAAVSDMGGRIQTLSGFVEKLTDG